MLLISCGLFWSVTEVDAFQASSDDAKAATIPEMVLGKFHVDAPTLGGQQYWTDYVHQGGWRIQANSEFGYYRLIDAQNIRRARGSFANCLAALKQRPGAGSVQPETGRIVILLHGLIRTSHSMDSLGEFLGKRNYQVINFRYASSRKVLKDHAKALHSVISHLGPGVTEINFVGHSMGNLVVRRYLHDRNAQGSSNQADPRIRRMVMIGPPNQGSRMARLLNRSLLFHTIAGKSGAELSAQWERVEKELATPSFEFGIIAGGQTNDRQLNNLLLSGPDDFTVSVEETKLAGAKDFLVRPLLHSNMMRQSEVMLATHRFLEHGYFVSESARQEIPRR